ncbi:hypothetical protein [Streptomyces sp. NPDC000878]
MAILRLEAGRYPTSRRRPGRQHGNGAGSFVQESAHDLAPLRTGLASHHDQCGALGVVQERIPYPGAVEAKLMVASEGSRASMPRRTFPAPCADACPSGTSTSGRNTRIGRPCSRASRSAQSTAERLRADGSVPARTTGSIAVGLSGRWDEPLRRPAWRTPSRRGRGPTVPQAVYPGRPGPRTHGRTLL